MDIWEDMMTYGQDIQNCTPQAEHDAKMKEDHMTDIYLVEYLILTVIKMLFNFYVIYLVVYRWNRREVFLTFVPILLLISEINQVCSNSLRIHGEENFTYSQFLFNAVNQYLYNSAHWIFVVQYFLTCKTLPYMLQDAQVNLELDEFIDQKRDGV